MQALILKNLQNDFLELGAIPLEGADAQIEAINQAMKKYDVVIAIQKWFPADHPGFAANHPWRKPEQVVEVDGKEVTLKIMHCVAESFGAAFPDSLNVSKINYIIQEDGSNSEAVLERINEIVAKHKVLEIEVMGPEN